MEVESKKITLRGEVFYFRINFRALIEFERMTGKIFSEANSLSMIDNANLLYSCAKAGMLYEKKPFDISFEDFVDLIDTSAEKIMNLVSGDEEIVPEEKIKKKT